MIKYDFGYELEKGSTSEWAFNKIASNSIVLEIGSSIGTLIYHLVRDKACIADIVEIDQEAGEKAARFARNSCIGLEEGNLENDYWIQKLAGNKYDYIIILDVLEHIRNPQYILNQLKSFLSTDGTILLSIPNIAHNSVILNLLRNRFEYTSLGLLDDTHVHFYTYESIKEMIRHAGLITTMEEVKQEDVGANEINVLYGNFPKSVESYLKTRKLGTAYQFLFEMKEGNSQPCVELLYEKAKPYEFVAFDTKDVAIIQNSINPTESTEIIFDVPQDSQSIRIDPLNTNCIITDITIIGITETGETENLCIKEHTGNEINNLYVFYDDDPQIYVEVPFSIKKISFCCKYLIWDNETLTLLIPQRDIFRQHQSDINELQHALLLKDPEIENLMQRLEISNCELKNLNHIIQQLTAKIGELTSNNETLNDKLNELTSSNETLNDKLNELTSDNEILNGKLDEMRNSIWGKIFYYTKRKG